MKQVVILSILFFSVIVLSSLSGCAGMAGLSAQNQQILQQGLPITMCSLKGEGYVVQSGLPIPIGQRMQDLDVLCAPIKAGVK